MNPIRPIVQAVRNYFNFRGRASRSEFWWLFVIVLFLEALFIIWQQEKSPLLILGFLKAPFKFVTLLPFVHLVLLPIATVRRLHDTDRSAKWLFVLLGTILGWLAFTIGFGMALSSVYTSETGTDITLLDIVFLMYVATLLLLLLPIAGEIAMLIILSLPGTKGANRYGPDPLLIQNRGHARDSNVATPDETRPSPGDLRRTITRKIIPALLVILIASTLWFVLCGREAKLAEISSGNNHVCGIKLDGSPECWGFKVKDHKPSPYYGQHQPPGGLKLAHISSGIFHTCALRMDGTPICWGHEKDGLSSPPPGETFIAISTGETHACALRADETPVCWGTDNHGQSSPPQGETFTRIHSGGIHTCALRQDGSPICWGAKGVTPDKSPAHPPSGEKFTAITAGGRHSCGLREDGAPVCWGNDDKGQATVTNTDPLMAISAGRSHTCALRQDGSPVCWGGDKSGWTAGKSDPPTHDTFVAISSGIDHTCALRQDGTPVCWGAYERNLP